MSDYKGQIIILDFMGANCEPCQLQLLELYHISNMYQSQKVKIISINVWRKLGETSETVKSLIDIYEQNGIHLDWTFLMDDKTGSIGKKYDVAGVPTIVIVDQNGNIFKTHSNYTNYQVLKSDIDKIR